MKEGDAKEEVHEVLSELGLRGPGGPGRQVRDGDFLSGSEEANFTTAQGGPSRSTCSECARCIYSLCTICCTDE